MKQKFYKFFIILSLALNIGCQSNNFSLNNRFDSFFKHNENKNLKNEIKNISISRKKVNFLPFTRNNAKINILKAVNNHPLVKLSEKRLQLTKSGISTTLAQKETQIILQGLAGVNRENSENLTGASGSVTLSKILYDFGSLDNAVLSQKERVNVASYQLKAQKEIIASQAFSSWIDLKKNNEILEIYNEGIDKAKPLLGQIKDISASGIADKALILKAKKEYSELLIEYEKAKSSQQIALKVFEDYYYGSSSTEVQNLYPIKVNNLKYHEKKMLNFSYNIKAQKSAIKSIEKNLESLNSRKKPNVLLKAGLTAPAEDPLEDATANAGVVVNYTYNDGGLLDSQIASAELQLQASKVELENLVKDLKLQLELLLENYNGALKTQLAAEKLVNESEEISKTTRARLVSGGSKISEVFSAEVALAKNKIILLNAEANVTLFSYNINSISSGLLKTLD